MNKLPQIKRFCKSCGRGDWEVFYEADLPLLWVSKCVHCGKTIIHEFEIKVGVKEV